MNRTILVIILSLFIAGVFLALATPTPAAQATLTAPTGISAPASPSELRTIVNNLHPIDITRPLLPERIRQILYHLDMVTNTTVNIPDANLKAAIIGYFRYLHYSGRGYRTYGTSNPDFYKNLIRLRWAGSAWEQIPADGDITLAEMLALTEFQSSGLFYPDTLKISNITGLEWAINLRGIDLGHHKITDVTPLTGLTKLDIAESVVQQHLGHLAPVRVDKLDIAVAARKQHFGYLAPVGLDKIDRAVSERQQHLGYLAPVQLDKLDRAVSERQQHLGCHATLPLEKPENAHVAKQRALGDCTIERVANA